MKNGFKTKVDIAVLQTKVDKIADDVAEIKNNHLVHLHERLDSIDRKLAYYSGGLAAVIALLEIFLRFIK